MSDNFHFFSKDKTMEALNSTKRLEDLRTEMRAKSFAAYMIPSGDAHNVSMIDVGCGEIYLLFLI